MMKDKPAAECLRYCVKQGTKYALVADKKVYTLEGMKRNSTNRRAKSHCEGNVERRNLDGESVIPAK